MAAPIRHFTEYAGLRPSIFAKTVPGNPAVIRLIFIKGVCPILKLLSSYIFDIFLLLSSLEAFSYLQYLALCMCRFQCLIKIGEDIIDVFQSHGYANRIGFNAGLFLFGWGQL